MSDSVSSDEGEGSFSGDKDFSSSPFYIIFPILSSCVSSSRCVAKQNPDKSNTPKIRISKISNFHIVVGLELR